MHEPTADPTEPATTPGYRHAPPVASDDAAVGEDWWRTEASLLGAALTLGIAADALLSGIDAPALGISLVLLLSCGACGVLSMITGLGFAARRRLAAFAALVALAPAWWLRSDPALLAAVVVASILAFTLTGIRIPGRRLRDLRVAELSIDALARPGRACGSLFRAVRRVPGQLVAVQDEDSSGSWLHRHGRDVATGVAIALPLLVLFTALLASADEGFADLVRSLFDWNVEELVRHVARTLILAVAIGTALIAVLVDRPGERIDSDVRGWARATVLWIVFGSLVALFSTFLALQASYLFGGSSYLSDAAGLTAADYARRGFFELLAVATIVFPLLLAFERWRSDDPAAHRAFRVCAPTLAGLTILLLGSAMARMWIYQDRFGLTELRLWATVALVWIALLLAWHALRVALARPTEFATFAAAVTIALVLVLVVVNPQQLIARTNIERADDARVDVTYLGSLGADAVPTIVAGFDDLDSSEQRITARILLEAYPYEARSDWRSRNRSRTLADDAIESHRGELEAAS